MAYQIGGNRGGNRGQQQSGQDWEKAIAFINMWLPLPNGRRHKLGSIALHESNVIEAALVQRLSNDPDGSALEAMFGQGGKIEVDFRLVDQNQDPNAVDLGF